ncbi:MAG TPA: hypothetical protein VM051_10050 [Usitatibacter sp.]|nr:hypothetical protein [Usitatibacter sp.]
MRFLLAFAVLVLALDAGAQMPRRDRGGSPRENREQPRAASPIVPGDPFSALERELPSLEVDLMLKTSQLDAWRVFARDVREVAEMGRAWRKHATSARDAGSLIASLAEDERLKHEAVADLRRHFDQLYSGLDDAQRRTLDRRAVQSQVEPLGR